jgi:hypothetical protein
MLGRACPGRDDFFRNVVNSVNTSDHSSTFPEIILNAIDQHGSHHKLLYDPGARFIYLVCPESQLSSSSFLSTFSITPLTSNFSIEFADTSSKSLSHQGSISMSLLDIHGQQNSFQTISFYVLPIQESCASPYFIGGRSFIHQFGLVCYGADSIYTGSSCLFTTNNDNNSGYSVLDQMFLLSDPAFRPSTLRKDGLISPQTSPCSNADKENNGKDVHAYHNNSSVLPDNVSLTFISPEVARRSNEVLTDCVGQGWRPLEFCPGFRISLRQLFSDESPDISSQTHVFDIAPPVPASADLHRRRQYAKFAYQKYSDEEKDIYYQLVHEYIDKKWWVPISDDDDTDDPDQPVCNVFMIKSGKKIRLVIDARDYNATLPPVTCREVDLPLILLATVLEYTGVICTIDAKAAFYKCRLSGTTLRLLTGIGEYVSRRLVFGVSFGPGGLHGSFGYLLDRIRLSCKDLLGLLQFFVDDVTLSGAVVAVAMLLALIVASLSACGHEFPLKKFQLAIHPSLRDELTAAFANEGISIPADAISTEATVIGVEFQACEDTLHISCQRQERLLEAKKLIVEAIQVNEVLTTKRQVFKICGLLAYDPCFQHVEARFFSDCLRILFGTVHNGTDDWDVSDATKFSSTQSAAAKYLFKTALDLCNDDAEIHCHHDVPIILGVSHISLFLACDSSLYGAGFALTLNSIDGPVVSQAAWLWRGSQLSHHSNRRELTCLLKAVQFLARYFEHRSKVTMKSSKTYSVTIFCDNGPAVRWCFGKVSSKSIEWRSLERLASAINEEIIIIRSLAVVDIKHISGCANHKADYLSRLGQKIISGVPLTIAIDGKLKSDKPPTIVDCLNTISTPVQDLIRPSFLDPLLGLCRTFSELCKKVRDIHYLCLLWRCKSKNFPVPAKGPVTNQHIITIVKAFQESDPWCKARLDQPSLLKPCGPYFLQDGVIKFRTGLPTGDMMLQYLIPRTAGRLRQLLFLGAHLESGHSSSSSMMFRLSSFYIPGSQKLSTKVVQECITCQKVLARRNWVLPPSVGSVNFEALMQRAPFSVVGIDFLTLGKAPDKKNIKVLTITCLATKAVCWRHCEHETTAEALRCLQWLSVNKNTPDRIICDQAACFTSSVFIDGCRQQFNAAVEFISVHSPWEGHYERHHGIGLITARKLYGSLQCNNNYVQHFLDSITSVINSRPLAAVANISNSNISSTSVCEMPLLITPNLLAYGWNPRAATSVLGDVTSVSSSSFFAAPKQVIAFRRFFLDAIWSQLKRKSLLSIQSKYKALPRSVLEAIKLPLPITSASIPPVFNDASEIITSTPTTSSYGHDISARFGPFSIGDPVLVFLGRDNKLKSSFSTGTIVDFKSGIMFCH